VADFFRRRLGREALHSLADPLLGAIHGGDPERLSMRAILPRFADLERCGQSLGIALWRAARKAPPGAPAFYSLEGGLSVLVNALVGSLPATGRRLSVSARTVRREGAGFCVETAPGPPVPARAVILALPPARTARLLQSLDPQGAAILDGIPVAHAITVHLAYRREDVAHPLDGHGLLVPRSERLRAAACSFVSTKFPDRAPGGHVLLRVAMGGMRDPDAVRLDEQELTRLAHDEMAGPLGLRGRPVLARAYRWPAATPQMEVGHLDRVAAMEERLAAWPGLFVTGGGVRGVGLPDVIADARRVATAAAALLTGR
jgi:oxygen-dependent protoporphyrinogen oxidase